MYGNENLIKDVLEYVVFEKHVSDEYGRWRIHEKIIPSWMPPREPLHKTYIKPDFEYVPPAEDEEGVKDTEKEDLPPSDGATLTPAVA